MAHIPEDHAEPGTMLWLPPKPSITDSMAQRGDYGLPACHIDGTPAQYRLFSHPIIVVSRPSHKPNKIYFVVATTFSNRTLQQRFPNGQQWCEYLTLGWGHSHPFTALATDGIDHYQSLTFEDGVENDKNSFVGIKTVYEMDWRDARPWCATQPQGTKFKLDQASLSRLFVAMGQFGWDPPTEYERPASPQARDMTYPAMCQSHASSLAASYWHLQKRVDILAALIYSDIGSEKEERQHYATRLCNARLNGVLTMA